MSLVVVSNRVARGKANEPMTGGLAAALLPVPPDLRGHRFDWFLVDPLAAAPAACTFADAQARQPSVEGAVLKGNEP